MQSGIDLSADIVARLRIIDHELVGVAATGSPVNKHNHLIYCYRSICLFLRTYADFRRQPPTDEIEHVVCWSVNHLDRLATLSAFRVKIFDAVHIGRTFLKLNEFYGREQLQRMFDQHMAKTFARLETSLRSGKTGMTAADMMHVSELCTKFASDVPSSRPTMQRFMLQCVKTNKKQPSPEYLGRIMAALAKFPNNDLEFTAEYQLEVKDFILRWLPSMANDNVVDDESPRKLPAIARITQWIHRFPLIDGDPEVVAALRMYYTRHWPIIPLDRTETVFGTFIMLEKYEPLMKDDAFRQFVFEGVVAALPQASLAQDGKELGFVLERLSKFRRRIQERVSTLSSADSDFGGDSEEDVLAVLLGADSDDSSFDADNASMPNVQWQAPTSADACARQSVVRWTADSLAHIPSSSLPKLKRPLMLAATFAGHDEHLRNMIREAVLPVLLAPSAPLSYVQLGAMLRSLALLGPGSADYQDALRDMASRAIHSSASVSEASLARRPLAQILTHAVALRLHENRPFANELTRWSLNNADDLRGASAEELGSALIALKHLNHHGLPLDPVMQVVTQCLPTLEMPLRPANIYSLLTGIAILPRNIALHEATLAALGHWLAGPMMNMSVRTCSEISKSLSFASRKVPLDKSLAHWIARHLPRFTFLRHDTDRRFSDVSRCMIAAADCLCMPRDEVLAMYGRSIRQWYGDIILHLPDAPPAQSRDLHPLGNALRYWDVDLTHSKVRGWLFAYEAIKHEQSHSAVTASPPWEKEVLAAVVHHFKQLRHRDAVQEWSVERQFLLHGYSYDFVFRVINSRGCRVSVAVDCNGDQFHSDHEPVREFILAEEGIQLVKCWAGEWDFTARRGEGRLTAKLLGELNTALGLPLELGQDVEGESQVVLMDAVDAAMSTPKSDVDFAADVDSADAYRANVPSAMADSAMDVVTGMTGNL